MTTVSQNSLTTGDYPVNSGVGYYDPWNTWLPYYVHPTWNPPVYIQPTYVNVPPQTVIFYPDDGLKEEVKGLKEEIKKLRKELAKK